MEAMPWDVDDELELENLLVGESKRGSGEQARPALSVSFQAEGRASRAEKLWA
jgi:hypothetical protein